MNTETTSVRITAVLNKSIGQSTGLVKNGMLPEMNLTTGRSLVLHPQHPLVAAFAPGMSLVGDPVDVISFLVAKKLEETALGMVISHFGLDMPGRGSVYSQDVQLVNSHDLCKEITSLEGKNDKFRVQNNLTGICCIVQRGQGDRLARVALDTGACVPWVTFGEGTGLRDKLGLLRITIPAQKDIVGFVASSNDAETVMDMMIDVGKLDQPGRGFIYLYPVVFGSVDMKMTRGTGSQAASAEQMIVALDEIKGGTEWRRREMIAGKADSGKRPYLRDLMELRLLCDEGRAADLVACVMDAGAAGATISKMHHVCRPDSPLSKISPAREVCTIIVGKTLVPILMEALDKNGAFDDSTHGQVQVTPVPKACTYMPAKSQTGK
jgi:hypothetical protein